MYIQERELKFIFFQDTVLNGQT